MRLINVNTMVVEVIPYDERPKYAILSHTWGKEEVTLEDMRKGCARDKRGHQKIEFCCQQAKTDGLGYVWIDTCCIDKSSSSELSEAINSMFRWYTESSICYAYLEDVGPRLSSHFKRSSEGQEEAQALEGALSNVETKGIEDYIFEKVFTSRWWTRGWTLQELIAPRNLMFYDSLWNAIGSREHHSKWISEKTTVSRQILKGDPRHSQLYRCSVAQRMSWAAERETTREEDRAYCLLGLFDVNIPLLYGEGARKSFIRLQEAIMRNVDDHSLFAWASTSAHSVFNNSGLLASGPQDFAECSSICPLWDAPTKQINEKTNLGLRITSLLFEARLKKGFSDHDNVFVPPSHFLLLRCFDYSQPRRPILVALKKANNAENQFVSNCDAFTAEPILEISRFVESKTIFVCDKTSSHYNQGYVQNDLGRYVSFNVRVRSRSDLSSISVDSVTPSEQWDSQLSSISRPKESVELLLCSWTWNVKLDLDVWLEKGLPESRFLVSIGLGFNGRIKRCRCWCRETLPFVQERPVSPDSMSDLESSASHPPLTNDDVDWKDENEFSTNLTYQGKTYTVQGSFPERALNNLHREARQRTSLYSPRPPILFEIRLIGKPLERAELMHLLHGLDRKL